MEERRPIAIQQAIRDPRRSAVGKYQDLVVGSRSVLRLLLHELVITTTSWIPGALGLVLRRICYPWLLGAVGRNVTFGAGVVLRHPAKIRLGDDVVVDDLVMLDAKGETEMHNMTPYVVSKLNRFYAPAAARRMLCQPTGLDFGEVIASRRMEQAA